MLGQITFLTSTLFAVIYPLFFLLSLNDPLRQRFHRFHIGLPTIICGLIFVHMLRHDIPMPLRASTGVWLATLLLICAYTWKKDHLPSALVLIPGLAGLITYIQLHQFLNPTSMTGLLTSLLGGAIFCAALYAMNLGHWYLNVQGLPIHHLRRAVHAFWILVIIRALWNVAQLFSAETFYDGGEVPVMTFMLSLDGFMVWIALFFGTLFPLVGLYFAHETVKLKNTQATTGILYVILCAVIIGEMSYKYYLLKFGIAL